MVEALFTERGMVEALFTERGKVEALFTKRGMVEALFTERHGSDRLIQQRGLVWPLICVILKLLQDRAINSTRETRIDNDIS